MAASSPSLVKAPCSTGPLDSPTKQPCDSNPELSLVKKLDVGPGSLEGPELCQSWPPGGYLLVLVIHFSWVRPVTALGVSPNPRGFLQGRGHLPPL